MPIKTYAQAINEATAQLLKEDERYFLIGEGVPDPKGCFGTTTGLKDKFPKQVFDMPVSENGMTGVCVGAAASGFRPIMVHMRPDFLMYAMDQIVNMAAKLHFMYGGQLKCPMVIRAIVGRGWGQGCQHSQHLEMLFAQVPGLKVFYPSNAYNAKGLLIQAARDNNPVIFLEHRWLHETTSEVPDEMYAVNDPLRVVREGKDFTISTSGYTTTLALKAAEFLSEEGIELEIRDIYQISQHYLPHFFEKRYPMTNTPPAPSLTKEHYTTVADIVEYVSFKLDRTPVLDKVLNWQTSRPHDVPNPDFRGPF